MANYKHLRGDIVSHKDKSSDKNNKAKKSATSNQWTNTGLDKPAKPERRDGPGGENGK